MNRAFELTLPTLLARIVLSLLLMTQLLATAVAQDRAVELELEGALGVATSEYIITGIEDAEASGAKLVIIRMDTPGGLVEPMRDIVSAILNSEVPVVTLRESRWRPCGQRRHLHPPGQPRGGHGTNNTSWGCNPGVHDGWPAG